MKGLESDVGDRAQILRLNVQDDIAMPLMRQYSAFATPTFLVLDGSGEVVWRQANGILDRDEAMAALGLS